MPTIEGFNAEYSGGNLHCTSNEPYNIGKYLNKTVSFSGFDPFVECNKGLADLLASERSSSANNGAQDARPNIGGTSWPNSTGGNDNYFAHMNSNTSQQYSLFGDTSPGKLL